MSWAGLQTAYLSRPRPFTKNRSIFRRACVLLPIVSVPVASSIIQIIISMQMHSYLVLVATAAASLASGLSIPRSENTGLNVVPATYDGSVTVGYFLNCEICANRDRSCYYPIPDPRFLLQKYLGVWYQVAGTPFGETQGARCVTAEYQANVRQPE